MELLGHSISHYNGKKELDRKLVILHLANSVELILKDLVLDSGKSIYKNPKETITIHGCLSALEESKIKIPFQNKIELLIDERNALQHRFGSPNELTSIFYMNIAQQFFKEVLKKHYGQDYDEIISQFSDQKDLVAYRLGEPSNDQELEKLQELGKLHPLGALLSAWSYFEKTTEKFITEANLDFRRRRPFAMELARGGLEKYGISVPEELRRKMDMMRQLRNMAAHGHAEPSKAQVKETIKTIEELEKYLASLDLEPIREKAKLEQERHEAEKQEYLREREEHKRMQPKLDLEKEND
jgi:uncharacterized protein YutE (UPF0331/DUF86 family)